MQTWKLDDELKTRHNSGADRSLPNIRVHICTLDREESPVKRLARHGARLTHTSGNAHVGFVSLAVIDRITELYWVTIVEEIPVDAQVAADMESL